MKRTILLLSVIGLLSEPLLAAPPKTTGAKAVAKKPRKAKPKPEPLKGPWPPQFLGTKAETVTLTSKAFLQLPDAVKEASGADGTAPFAMAKTPPTVDLAYHRDLGSDAINRRLWSSWGDIGVASDGRVYCGIGDHGNAVGGDARCFIYCWDPKQKTLDKIVDMNQVVPPGGGKPAWSKVHAKIDEGPDGKIYFSCTLNAGNRAGLPQYHWNKQLPGGQLYQYDPSSGKTIVFANLPPRRCTATSMIDGERNLWWCNLEAGQGDALFAIDLNTGKTVHQTEDGTVSFNRNFALARDGSIYFNGADGIGHYDPVKKRLSTTKSSFSGSKGMRCSTQESDQGFIYGITHTTNQLFRYGPQLDELKMLGPNWLKGSYTTVAILSPDGRFVYYMPGSHGKAYHTGTPVVQYDIAKGRLKVLAFLAPAIEQKFGYVPSGSYGVKLSADGNTIYVNFNGHPTDSLRPAKMKPIGFGLCAFAAIHIPKSER